MTTTPPITDQAGRAQALVSLPQSKLWSTPEASEPDTSEAVMVHGVAISLFSGARGLDLGVEQAGFHVAAAVEINDDAADTTEKRVSGLVSPIIRRSILHVPTKELLRTAGLNGR